MHLPSLPKGPKGHWRWQPKPIGQLLYRVRSNAADSHLSENARRYRNQSKSSPEAFPPVKVRWLVCRYHNLIFSIPQWMSGRVPEPATPVARWQRTQQKNVDFCAWHLINLKSENVHFEQRHLSPRLLCVLQTSRGRADGALLNLGRGLNQRTRTVRDSLNSPVLKPYE